jgi:hypothetical protein
MTLEEILNHLALTKKNLGTFQANINYSIVVMLGSNQYQPDEINKQNIALYETAEIFAPGQNPGKLQKRLRRYNALKKESDELKKKVESNRNKNQEAGQPFQNHLTKSLALLNMIRMDLENHLETIQFVRSQIELRFDRCDIEAIQEIKEFPFIKMLGKTDQSAASIRVVVG